jgi:preprotein translocase subunit YajC
MPILSDLSFLAQQDAGQPAGGLGAMLMPILLLVLFYFMLIRPQRRQQKEHLAKLAALKTGDEVIAAGGIYGMISNINDRVVTLKVADNVKIRVDKNSILSVLKTEAQPASEEKPAA